MEQEFDIAWTVFVPGNQGETHLALHDYLTQIEAHDAHDAWTAFMQNHATNWSPGTIIKACMECPPEYGQKVGVYEERGFEFFRCSSGLVQVGILSG